MDSYTNPPFQPRLSLKEFFDSFGVPRAVAVDTTNSDYVARDQHDLTLLAMSLITEEHDELSYAVHNGEKLGDIVKELADLVYTCFYLAETLGVDLEEAFRRVHGSNMSKLKEDGTFEMREDGKILKGPNYKPPVMDDSLKLPITVPPGFEQLTLW